MTGFLIYLVHAHGLAFFVPRAQIDGRVLHGAQYFCGVCLIPLLLFLLHFVLGLDIRVASYLVSGIAALGLMAEIFRWWRNSESRAPLYHPVHVLVLLVLAAGILNGEVGYIPYLSDEFRTWIGVSKQIYALGRFDPSAMFLSNPDNRPGWAFVMVFPSLLMGRYQDAYAGLAPAVMHVGMIAFIYDVAVAHASRQAWLDRHRAILWAWVLIGVLLLGEASGRLVAGNLLSEPPQVYGLSVIAVALLGIALSERRDRGLPLVIGIVLATEYLIKIPAIAYIPAIILFGVWMFLRDRGAEAVTTGEGVPLSDGKWRAGTLVKNLSAMLGPVLVVYACWKLRHVPVGGAAAPETIIQWLSLPSLIIAPESLAMLMRVATAVFDYVLSYKVPVTAIAALGLAYGVSVGKTRAAVLTVILYVLCYMAAFALYHLIFWHNLNSVPRFTRVPLRVLHLMGGFLWFVLALEILGRERWASARELLVGRRGTVTVFLVLAVLLGWQGFLADRMIVDLTTRRFQGMDDVYRAIPSEAARLRSLTEVWKEDGPLSVININQGRADDELGATFHYLVRPVFGIGISDFEIVWEYSWGQSRQNQWMDVAGYDDLEKTFGKVNIIWPLRLDDWMEQFLRERIDDPACAENPLRYFLVPKPGPRLALSCIPKS